MFKIHLSDINTFINLLNLLVVISEDIYVFPQINKLEKQFLRECDQMSTKSTIKTGNRL